MMKEKGIAELVALGLILAAFVVGFSVHRYTGKNDTPIEQAAEAVLESYDIEYDFSPDDEKVD